MKSKSTGIIIYCKLIKDNDLFIKILSNKDKFDSGIVIAGNSSKKKLLYQLGYFIDYNITQKNINSPLYFNAEITKPFLGSAINDKYKLNAILSILSLTNISIIEGQTIKGLYISIYNLITEIINNKHWLRTYCKWLLFLLKVIGYQIDYENNLDKIFFDTYNQEFLYQSNKNTVVFPHNLFLNKNQMNFNNINIIFLIFEKIFSVNHLENMNYKMPLSFINFKKIVLLILKDR